MARGDYAPEIRTSMATGGPKRVNTSPPKESPADAARDKMRGIKEGSPQDQKLDAIPANQAPPPRPMHMQTAPSGDMPPNPAHAAMAASIAHAILGGGRNG
jgi:hypothetical protein